jgi:hypothetical protein
MKHNPLFLGKGELWSNYVDKINVHPTALDECISTTERYWNKVKEYL